MLVVIYIRATSNLFKLIIMNEHNYKIILNESIY